MKKPSKLTKVLNVKDIKKQKLGRKTSSYELLVENVEALLIKNFDVSTNLRSKGKQYIKGLVQVGNNRGLATMIKSSKEARLYVTRYLSGHPLMDSSINIQLTGDKLPVRLGPELLRVVRKGTHLEKRWLLTLLYATRSIVLPVNPDVESIIAPNRSEKLDSIHCEMLKHRHSFWRSLGLRKPCKPETTHGKNFHITTNLGPNGHGLGSWWTDLKALPSSLINSIITFGGNEIKERIEVLTTPSLSKYGNSWFPTKKQSCFRKITSIPDKEGKTRVIAIGDYGSQSVLKPFHTNLFSVLRRIKQDCTFNQSAFIPKLAGQPGPFYSMDLSNATDRFPIDSICLLLKGHYDSKMIDAGKDIMVGYSFSFKGSKPINYSVGNPMGFYSSWASFAVAHHFVVYLGCKRLKMDFRSAPYVLLGDDIVIANEKLSNEYRSIMEDLGVDISVNKTHVSEHTYEFAKQGIHKGQNITPFPVGGGREVCNRYNLSVNFLQTLQAKGGTSTNGIVSVVSGGAVITKKPARFRADIEVKTAVCEIVTSVMRGDLKGVLAINMLVRLKENRDFEYKLEDYNADYIFQRACMEAFVDANDPKSNRNGKPLGLFAETLVTMMTDPDTPFMEVGCGPYFVPPLNVYGEIEEQYTRLNRLAGEVDTFRNGDGPLIMRSLTIPTSDDAFLVRQKDILPMAAANIGKRIFEKLEEFRQIKRMYPNM